MMRLTRQYAYGFLASVSDEDKLSIYYELQKTTEILTDLENYVSILEFDPEEMEKFSELLGDEFRPLVINFLRVLAQDGLLNRLDTITEDYRFGLVEEDLLVEVSVSSASPLSEEFKNKIGQLVQENWTKSYMIDFTVNSDLIGGVRLEANNAVIDTTFQSRINQILREV